MKKAQGTLQMQYENDVGQADVADVCLSQVLVPGIFAAMFMNYARLKVGE